MSYLFYFPAKSGEFLHPYAYIFPAQLIKKHLAGSGNFSIWDIVYRGV